MCQELCIRLSITYEAVQVLALVTDEKTEAQQGLHICRWDLAQVCLVLETALEPITQCKVSCN